MSFDRQKFSHATIPTNEIVQKRASYVNINSTGSFAFLYETTSSVGGTTAGEINLYETGSVVTREVTNSSAMTPFRLDINPVAWKKTDSTSTVGDVTFVYVRVA